LLARGSPRFFDSAALERGDESLTMLDKCQKVEVFRARKSDG
jgi:hypothetical protein